MEVPGCHKDNAKAGWKNVASLDIWLLSMATFSGRPQERTLLHVSSASSAVSDEEKEGLNKMQPLQEKRINEKKEKKGGEQGEN